MCPMALQEQMMIYEPIINQRGKHMDKSMQMQKCIA